MSLVADAYRVAVGAWGIQPSEFWAMDCEEWWWLYDVKRSRDPAIDYAGGLSQDDVDDLIEFMREGG